MKIGIIRLTSLGDIVNSMIVLQYLKNHRPDIEIHWFVDECFTKIPESNPDISAVHPIKIRANSKSPVQLYKEIKERFAGLDLDMCIDMQGLIKSAVVSRAICKNISGFSMRGAKEGIGTVLYKKKVHVPYEKNIIFRNMTLISKIFGFSWTQSDIYDKRPFLNYPSQSKQKSAPVFSEEKKNIILLTGSSDQIKNYPAEKLAILSGLLEHNIILSWGNEEELQKALYIKKLAPHVNIMPPLDLDELKAAIDRADMVIGPDTGPIHMAWALNTPSIALYGTSLAQRNSFETPMNRTITGIPISDISPEKIARQAVSLLDS